MSRPFRTRALAAVLALAAAACQDYNFNPVGQCVIQPGSQRFTLSSVSTADVLFVMDESGSMGGEQAALAANFDAFVNNLNQANVDRAASGLEPIDFHLAVTTSSVFWNEQTTSTCRTDCPGAVGQAVCCSSDVPDRKPRACAGAGAACPATTTCRLDCNAFSGAFHCCAADGSFPTAAITELVPCSRVGTMCGGLQTHYDMRGCSSPIATNEWPYARGDFVSKTSSSVAGFAGQPGPRVVHFDKELYGAGAKNRQNFTQAQLIAFFKENIQVGTCGSGQEQGLQGGRLALQKAFAGAQRDTYDAGGTLRWTAPTATVLPGSTPARWPNPNSKVVLVFVGDEDDCSSPQDPSGGVVMLSGEGPGVDACSRDALSTTDVSIRNKQFPVSEFVSYFTSLGRPVAAGFILPAAQTSCTLETCTTAGLCCHPTLGCDSVNGAQAPGTRLLATAHALQQAGVEVVAGSICDGSFATVLNDIAEIVKPPETLTLPTVPADSRIALLRIASANGATRKLCTAPLPPTQPNYSLQAAKDTGADWWFTAADTAGPPFDPSGNSTVSVPSRFVYINPNGNCRANPGETYSADYLGVVPARTVASDPMSGGCANDTDCTLALGGQPGAFECYVPDGLSRGTCTCRSTQ